MPRFKIQAIDDHGEPVGDPCFYTADTERKAHADYCDDMNAQGKRPAPKVRITRAEGKPGSGVCICSAPPEKRKREAEAQARTASGCDAAVLKLDHRCPLHGEKAQPALWGRHKELALLVTPAQWDSLGITYEAMAP